MLKSWYQSRKIYLWPPRGTWGGYKGVRPPKKEKSCFQPYFWRKKIPFTSRIIWDITTKPHSLQKLGVDPFLVQKWTKNCKKTADFKVAKKVCLTVNSLSYSKNQLFQTSSIAQIFKNQEFCHSGLSQPKNFRVRTPLSSNNEKKILQKAQKQDLNSRPQSPAKYASCAVPTKPPRLWY